MPVNTLKSCLVILFTLFLSGLFTIQAQQPAFYHLSTAEGLSDNNVNYVSRDQTGILWIATSEGLNSFDGNRITTYYKQQYPQLAENNIGKVLVDRQNRIWIKTASHFLTMIDEKRRFHKITVGSTRDTTIITGIFLTHTRGLVAMKGRQHFFHDQTNPLQFKKEAVPFEKNLQGFSSFFYYLNNGKVVYYIQSRLIVVDYNTQQLELDHFFPGLAGVNYFTDDELLLYTEKGNVFFRFSISKKKTVHEYRNIPDQYRQPLSPDIRNVTRIDSNRFALSTRHSGLYIVNFSGNTAAHYTHDPVDPRSIGSNNTTYVRYDSSGYLFVATYSTGLHFFHLNQQPAAAKMYFRNEKGEVFDGLIQSVTADASGHLWLGAEDRLIRWNKTTDKTEFIFLNKEKNKASPSGEAVHVLKTDNDGNIWAGTARYGLFVLNKQLKILAHLTDSMPGTKKGLPYSWINTLQKDRAGNWWVGTGRGVGLVTGKNFEARLLTKHPVLAPLSKLTCTALWQDDKGDMWIGTVTKGLWHYSEKNNFLKQYTTREGLASDYVQAISNDNLGNIYIGTASGLSILSPGKKIMNYNRSNGLRNDRCENITKDEKGYMWIGNLNYIIRFDPSTKTFTVFDEGSGFSNGGFRMRASYQLPGGELIWGTDKGITWFLPEQISKTGKPLLPFINALQTGGQHIGFTQHDTVSLPYNAASVQFRFSSGDLSGDKRNQFQYRLEGFDKSWQTPSTTGEAVYSHLPPGHYQFHSKVSRDGITWFSSVNTIYLSIAKPWWRQTWFLALLVATIAGVLAFGFYYLDRRRKNKMALLLLNTKMAETKFLNLRLQMNPHFLFNSLSAIQHLIVSQQTNKAYKYLTVFSNFLRSLLNYADKNFILLDDELKTLNMYVELESLRFDSSFSYNITADETLLNEQVLLPSLMIQPFVENAIWHGLLHKEGAKTLSVVFRFSSTPGDSLVCVITDNGIGRAKAAEIKKNKISSRIYASRGMEIIKERLELLQQKTGKPAEINVRDLVNENQEPCGTEVTILIPFYNPETE